MTTIENKIKKVLDKIRPHLKMDGGDVEFIGFNEKTGELSVKLMGACHGCPMAQVTLKEGIGKLVMEEVKEVKKIKSV